ncbi:HTH-type transcriptional regulator CatM [Roseovarius sp. THAF9]|uniref:LysR family transcriptional regulator n=1 Tax=Roseovarius sp. THAF9 TaxID=2587847 RepID=UPI0012686DE3|nr:LysR family transcriptional regulator [Roseovarius sp. THAF9]QFT94459.1 HTH-type transcriptional regulator CatM [Roseovarius sp. THAF9]
MRTVNLPTDLLRTFVTVIEVESYTRAADLLGRSQPAVSLQIKRLEDLVGYKLITQKGRTMQVSERGDALAMHARQILRINDRAMGLFDQRRETATLRVGLGFSAPTASTIQTGMRPITAQNGLPDLDPLQIGVFYRQTRLGSWGDLVAGCLTDTIESSLHDTTSG